MDTGLDSTRTTRLPPEVEHLLRCPLCMSRLVPEGTGLACAGPSCPARFPVVDGVPVLLNEAHSLWSIAEARARRPAAPRSRLRRIAERLGPFAPSIGINVRAAHNFRRFAALLLERTASPRVLVVGGRIPGKGIKSLAAHRSIALVETDVAWGPRTRVICDGHDLPFDDASFDGVVAQAMLHLAVDPRRCVDQMHRVLKPDGLVYAETPFMQQGMGRNDFTRFTHLGLRRLFRRFDEVDSGAVCGPGMALAWAYQSFLLSFVRSDVARAVVKGFATLTAFYLKYLDYVLVDRPGAIDAASGVFFLGRRCDRALDDRDLVALYRGAA